MATLVAQACRTVWFEQHSRLPCLCVQCFACYWYRCWYFWYNCTVTNYGVVVAGQDDAVASAEQINKVENYRDPDSFADIVRGMHLYGRKILRPEALITARYNAA